MTSNSACVRCAVKSGNTGQDVAAQLRRGGKGTTGGLMTDVHSSRLLGRRIVSDPYRIGFIRDDLALGRRI